VDPHRSIHDPLTAVGVDLQAVVASCPAPANSGPPRRPLPARRHRHVDVSVDGQPTQTISVSGVPRLYTLYQSSAVYTERLLLHASPGTEAHDFTFG